jgi:putative oxidoreductase
MILAIIVTIPEDGVLTLQRPQKYRFAGAARSLPMDGFCAPPSTWERGVMKVLLNFYARFGALVSYLQSPFLLVVRLYWGWQFAQSGWGKLHHLERISGYFMSLNIPFSAASAHFIAALEFIGGILLILGLGSRLIGLLLSFNMLVAYWTADRDALLSVFSDPGKFYVADPYTFLFASAMILVFGAGIFSIDALLAKRWRPWLERK